MKSSRVFCVALKHVGMARLQKIFRRSSPMVRIWAEQGNTEGPCCGQNIHPDSYPSERIIHAYAANPRYVEFKLRNVLDQIRDLIEELDNAGFDDYARFAINYMAEPLDMRLELPQAAESDKKCIDAEGVDVMQSLAHLMGKLREYKTKGRLCGQLAADIDAAEHQFHEEFLQLIDASGHRSAE